MKKITKINSNGFSHLVLVAIIFIFMGLVGYAGFRIYNRNDGIEAKAAGWHWQSITTKYENWGVNLSGKVKWKACKLAKGSLYQVYLWPQGGYELTKAGYTKSKMHASVLSSGNASTKWTPMTVPRSKYAMISFQVDKKTGGFNGEFYAESDKSVTIKSGNSTRTTTTVSLFSTPWIDIRNLKTNCL